MAQGYAAKPGREQVTTRPTIGPSPKEDRHVPPDRLDPVPTTAEFEVLADHRLPAVDDKVPDTAT
jgi:hypothetical protein